jgi:DNA-binding transcriptional ArsR family regulator
VAAGTRKRAGQRRKTIEEVVEYALSHRIRSRILSILNQGIYTCSELAEFLDQPLNRTGNHIRELLDAGSIEIADTKRRRNAQQHYYRAVRTPYFSEREAKAMTRQERQVSTGLIIQGLMAEVMTALWAGRMFLDPRDWFTWERVDLDAEGRQELYDEQKRSWERVQSVKARAAKRVADSGGETDSYIVSVLGFEQAERAPKPSHSADTE